MGHWYDKEGRPVYEVPKKDGTGMRRPTKRDARKHGYYPGVTSVIDVIAKPGLTNWLIRQPLISAVKATDLDDMRASNPEGWIQAIHERTEEQKDKAPDLGSKIHRNIENYLKWINSRKKAIFTIDPEVKEYVRVFKDWFEKQPIKIGDMEVCVANPNVGYGGKLDFKGVWDGKPCYIDWKTTRFRKGKATFYPSWGCQIAAYAVADVGVRELASIKMVSVAIDSTKPGLIETKVWDHPMKYWDLFKLCMQIYKSPLGANWDPSGKAGT